MKPHETYIFHFSSHAEPLNLSYSFVPLITEKDSQRMILISIKEARYKFEFNQLTNISINIIREVN